MAKRKAKPPGQGDCSPVRASQAWWQSRRKTYPFRGYLHPASAIKKLIDAGVRDFTSVSTTTGGRLYGFRTAEELKGAIEAHGLTFVACNNCHCALDDHPCGCVCHEGGDEGEDEKGRKYTTEGGVE